MDYRNFELRSEKVRGIIEHIPPALTRYGIMIVTFVLFVLVWTADLIPYKKYYTGTATIYTVNRANERSENELLLKFGSKVPDQNLVGSSIDIIGQGRKVSGQVVKLNMKRDTLERQVAVCSFYNKELEYFENSCGDFVITYVSGSLLEEYLGW